MFENELKQFKEKLEKLNKTEEFERLFLEFSEILMNNYQLRIENEYYEFAEIEYYYFKGNNHEDTTTHLDNFQKKELELYVHKKWENYGGIDLTFGDEKCYGGIFIRTIKDKSNNKFIVGPALSRNHIIEKIDSCVLDSYQKLQKYFEEKNSWSIEEIDETSKTKNIILHSTRFGLSETCDEKYKNALYRFLREDLVIAKQVSISEKTKARAITFLTRGEEVEGENFTAELEKIKKDEPLMEIVEHFKKNK